MKNNSFLTKLLNDIKAESKAGNNTAMDLLVHGQREDASVGERTISNMFLKEILKTQKVIGRG